MGIRYPGRARIDPDAPQALGICDKCGFQYNLRELDWQWGWHGPNLVNLNILVCEECMDDPSEQLRTIVLPPDPPPLYIDVRPENFALDEKNYLNLKQPPNGQPAMLAAVGGMRAQLLNAGKIIEMVAMADTSAMTARLAQSHTIAPAMTAVGAFQGQFQGTVPITGVLAGTSALTAIVSVGMRTAPTLAGTGALTASLQYTGGMFAQMAGTSAMAGPVLRGQHITASMGDTSAMAAVFEATPPPSITYEGEQLDSVDRQNYTFSSVNFGTAVASRRIVAAVHWGNNLAAITLSSATIGGVSATIHGQAAGTNNVRVALISALVPTGTSGSIVINLSASASRCAVAAYRAVNETSGSPTQFNSDNTVSSGQLSTTVNVPTNGWVVAAETYNVASGAPFAWTGLNEQYDATLEAAAVYYTGGFEGGLSLQSNRPISCQSANTGGTNSGALVAMSWG